MTAPDPSVLAREERRYHWDSAGRLIDREQQLARALLRCRREMMRASGEDMLAWARRCDALETALDLPARRAEHQRQCAVVADLLLAEERDPASWPNAHTIAAARADGACERLGSELVALDRWPAMCRHCNAILRDDSPGSCRGCEVNDEDEARSWNEAQP